MSQPDPKELVALELEKLVARIRNGEVMLSRFNVQHEGEGQSVQGGFAFTKTEITVNFTDFTRSFS